MAREFVHRVSTPFKTARSLERAVWDMVECEHTREANGEAARNKGWALAKKISPPFCCHASEPEASGQGSRPNLYKDKYFWFLPTMHLHGFLTTMHRTFTTIPKHAHCRPRLAFCCMKFSFNVSVMNFSFMAYISQDFFTQPGRCLPSRVFAFFEHRDILKSPFDYLLHPWFS